MKNKKSVIVLVLAVIAVVIGISVYVNSADNFGVSFITVKQGETQDNNDGNTCTISINCETISENTENLNPDKKDIVPEDGMILEETKVTFKEGESVFDILKKVTRENNIHMEFVDTPLYNSSYIEGISNIYEFDCGALSGWLYSVNGKFPNYGCSKYNVKSGDVIEWQYTCDLGKDLGNEFSVEGQR